MSESDERRFERVCVALDAVASGATVLETAAGLAADLQAELAAFFVEDENVVRAAAFPFARDLGSASATSRQMRVEEVQQALRAQARALKSSVAAAAERLRLQWSFTTLPGSGIAPVLGIANATNVTVLGPRRAFPVPSAPARSRAHLESASDIGSIGLLCSDSRDALAAFRMAALLARRRAAPLAVILPALDEGRIALLQRDMEAGVAPEASSLRRFRIDETSPRSIAEAARGAGVSLLVLPVGALAADELGDLLGRVSSPLVLMS